MNVHRNENGMIDRAALLRQILEGFSVHPIVALTGPRQCGKTTLARAIARQDSQATYFDLESAVDRRQLETPEHTLGRLEGLVVIDEIQRLPHIFETLRVLVDRETNRARFLLLGSASPHLIKGVSESLAGRVGLVDMGGFSLGEVGTQAWRELWLRGGFPRSFLAPDPNASMHWRENFIATFLERDMLQLGITIPAEAMRRFWTMVAHYHGQVWNAAEFARALGASQSAARRYLDVLAGAFLVRVLPPWFENLKKRQVKAPKVYMRDSGILHSLLELSSENAIAGHPKVGASFEGFAIEQLLTALETRNAYYWATHAGAEIDLLVFRGAKRFGFECKLSDAPGTTRSMRIALESLRLDHIWVLYPGDRAYALDTQVTALPISQIHQATTQMESLSDAR